MTRAASVVLAFVMLVAGADEFFLRREMQKLRPPAQVQAVWPEVLPDVPPPPPPPPVPRDADFFP